MIILQFRSAIALFTCNCLVSMAIASSSSIGLVMATGDVVVDGQRVPGNSAIFSGSRISSGDKTSNLQFSDGTSAVMNPGTTMTVYRERSVLQQGVTTQHGIDKHFVLANGLRISSTTSNVTALVGVRNDSYMEVSARDGEADVWNASGKLVAKVEPGQPRSFTYQQAPAGGSVDLCGRLRPGYLLSDKSTHATYKLKGSDLDPFMNKRVRVAGTMDVTGGTPSSTAPSVVTVDGIQKLQGSCDAAGGEGKRVGLILIGIGALAGVGTLIGVSVGSGSSAPTPPPVTPSVP
ncbi:hypothetical protein [Granulicella mallensis]|jgi:hypothetical protein|uniref:FecR protein domain-containing protein n=1 Tax=Granulicella mallensis TaxID=940614 RepID=A0A7W8EB83_9BACT|nr:hypothetical protein [Granulicella mallensis]MBB5066438.1 hypothetical protein [Granulicella mallensis]